MRFLAVAAALAAASAQQFPFPLTGSISGVAVPFELQVPVTDDANNYTLILAANRPIVESVGLFFRDNRIDASNLRQVLQFAEGLADTRLAEAIQKPAESPIVASFFEATFRNGASAVALQFTGETPEAAARRFVQDQGLSSMPDMDMELRTFVGAFIDNNKTPFSAEQLEELRRSGRYPVRGNTSVVIGSAELTVGGTPFRISVLPGETAEAALLGFLSRTGFGARVSEEQTLQLLNVLAESVERNVIIVELTVGEERRTIAAPAAAVVPAVAIRAAEEGLARLGISYGAESVILQQVAEGIYERANAAQAITRRAFNATAVEEGLREADEEADARAAEAEEQAASADLLAAAPSDREITISVNSVPYTRVPVNAGDDLRATAEVVCSSAAQGNTVLFQAFLQRQLAMRGDRYTPAARSAAIAACAGQVHAVFADEYAAAEAQQAEAALVEQA